MPNSRLERIAAALLVPVAILVFCALFYTNAMRLPDLAFSYPQTIIGIIVFFAAAHFIDEGLKAYRRRHAADDTTASADTGGEDIRFSNDLLMSVGILLASVSLAPLIGLSLTAALLIAALYLALFRERPLFFLALAVGLGTIFYVLFVLLFDLPLNRI